MIADMFERFTDDARAAVVVSQEAARELSHEYIGTEHLLLGLFARPDALAARALAGLGFSRDSVRAAVVARVGVGGSLPTGHIPFTPRCKTVLERALTEAASLQHSHIGTEHLLLALLDQPDATAAQILSDNADDLDAVRTAVLDLIAE